MPAPCKTTPSTDATTSCSRTKRTTEGHELLLRQRTEASADVQILLDQLELTLPPQAPPRIRTPQGVSGDPWGGRTMNQRLAEINAPQLRKTGEPELQS
jgi:hypothetical protein